MHTEHISRTVESWILEEDLPSRASLKPMRQFDGLVPEDDEERRAYWDFISWFMGQEHLTLQSLPKPEEGDFWPVELDESGNDISAFNTEDFERLYPFDRYHWKVKKMCEKVRELAITHSCISDEEGRKNIKNRFLDLVTSDCKEKMMTFFEIWRQYAYWE